MTTYDQAAQDGLRPLALLALGRTGADIERLVREARRAARRSGRSIRWADIECALRAGEEALSADLRKRAAIHEAGHALVYTLIGVADVHCASIGLNGIGMVAVTTNVNLAQTEGWLMNSIACLLAGRVAERLILGNVAAGSGGADDSDLARATSMALAAETSFGFSEHQPLLYRSTVMGMTALNHDPQLAGQVNRRLERAEAMAGVLIEENRAALHEIAGGLEHFAILSGNEVRLIVRRASGRSQTTGANVAL